MSKWVNPAFLRILKKKEENLEDEKSNKNEIIDVESIMKMGNEPKINEEVQEEIKQDVLYIKFPTFAKLGTGATPEEFSITVLGEISRKYEEYEELISNVYR